MAKKKRRGPKNTYLGKELKPPFDGPKFSMIPNPAKVTDDVSLTVADRRDVVDLIGQVTNVAELERLAEILDRQLTWARINRDAPDMVRHENWPGRISQQMIKCGKAQCKKCVDGPGHGPYWYHSVDRSD